MTTYKNNKIQTTIKIGAYTQKPSIALVEEPTPDSRPATTTDIKVKETPAPKKVVEEPKPKPKKAFEYDTQPVKKKSFGKTKCTPTKALLAILLTLIGIIVLVGLIFLIIYLATLGKQSKDSFCMSDYSCLTNSSLYCLNAKCSCYSNTTWNSTKSVCATNTTTINSTNTTNTTLPIVTYPVTSVVKIFNGSAYSVTSVAAYAGTAFSTLYDVAYSPITDDYYITDNGASLVVVTDSNFNYIKKAYLQDCWYIDIYNTSVYVTTYSNLKIYRLDLNLFWLNTYLSTSTVYLYNVLYSTHANLVYSCDYWNGWITAYDSSLNKLNSESFSVGSCVTSATVSSNTLYIGRASTQIFTYVNKAPSATYTICSSGWVQDIIIDTSSGTNYMFVSCSADKRIYLYTVASSSATYLNLFITTAGNPYGMAIDQYGRLLVAMQNPHRVDVYKLT